MSQDERHPLGILNNLLIQEVEEHEREYGTLAHVLFYFEMSDATLKELIAKNPFFTISIIEERNDFYNKLYAPKENFYGAFHGGYHGFISQHNEHPKGKVILRKAFSREMVKLGKGQ